MKTYKLELTEEMLKGFQAAIGEVPMKFGVAFLPMANEMNRQIAEQNKPAALPQTERLDRREPKVVAAE